MTLPAKAQWKAASDKEMASLKKNNVYILLPATFVPEGHKIIGRRWVYKVNADNSLKGRAFVLGWGQLPGIDCGKHVYSRLQAPEHPYGAGNSGGVQSGMLSARLQHRVSERRFHRGSLHRDGTRIRGTRRKRSPTGNEALEKPMRPSPEPDRLVEHCDRQTSGGNWLQKSQVGPVRLPGTPTRSSAPFIS